jgi:hypothetical protein
MRKSAPVSATILSILAPGLIAAAVCGGCTIMQGEGPQQTESMLVTAGFKMNLADTPAEMALIEAKPQKKVTPLKRGDKLFFGYADAKGCKCSYLGDEAAYQKYETLLVDNRMVEESRSEPAINEPVDVVLVTDDDEWEAWGGVVIGE